MNACSYLLCTVVSVSNLWADHSREESDMDRTPLWSEDRSGLHLIKDTNLSRYSPWTFETAKGLKDMIGLWTIEESCPLDSSLLWYAQRLLTPATQHNCIHPHNHFEWVMTSKRGVCRGGCHSPVAEHWQLEPETLGLSPGGTTFLSSSLPFQRSTDSNGPDLCLWLDVITIVLWTIEESCPSDTSLLWSAQRLLTRTNKDLIKQTGVCSNGVCALIKQMS